MARTSMLLVLLALVAVAAAPAMAQQSAAESSPAELAFSMAELSSSASAPPLSGASSELLDSFNSESASDAENEAEASDEGISDADIFAQTDEAAVVSADAQAEADAEAAPKSKMTPGVHCEQRSDCKSCLELSMCLWNPSQKSCVASSSVRILSPRAQWQFISTCNPHASPSQLRTDRRSSRHVKYSVADKLGGRAHRAEAIATSLVEIGQQSEAAPAAPMVVGGMRLLMDETPSPAAEAQLTSEAEVLEVPQAAANNESPRFASVHQDADSEDDHSAAHHATLAAAHGIIEGARQMHKLKRSLAESASSVSAAVDVAHMADGAPRHGGVDVWSVLTSRTVENGALGLPIGSVPSNARLVIEEYKYIARRHGGEQLKSLYGYGYVAGASASFGGWAGKNSCGWFPLQRASVSVSLQARMEAPRPRHARRCPRAPFRPTAGPLASSALLAPGSFRPACASRCPTLAAALVVKSCPAYRNYDASLGAPRGRALRPLESGSVSALPSPDVFGSVPVALGAELLRPVEGFGVRYKTRDGRFVLVSHPSLDDDERRANTGANVFYFVAADCLQFDQLAVTAGPRK